MKLKCNVCGYDNDDGFIGIFTHQNDFFTTDNDLCGLFGCPSCNTVMFVKDADYINKKKTEYKLKMKQIKNKEYNK